MVSVAVLYNRHAIKPVLIVAAFSACATALNTPNRAKTYHSTLIFMDAPNENEFLINEIPTRTIKKRVVLRFPNSKILFSSFFRFFFLGNRTKNIVGLVLLLEKPLFVLERNDHMDGSP